MICKTISMVYSEVDSEGNYVVRSVFFVTSIPIGGVVKRLG